METAKEQLLPPTLKEQHPPVVNAALKTIDDEVILSLHKQNYSTYQIAEYIGCNQSTVFRHLKKIVKKNEVVKVYKDQRADLLAYQQAEEYDIQAKLRDHLKVDSNIEALTEAQKKSWYDSFNISSGTRYDKERLERGQSTANMSVNSLVTHHTDKLGAMEAELSRLTGDTSAEE